MEQKKESDLVTLLTLRHMTFRVVRLAEKERAELLFRSREKAEKWLTSHGFVYGEVWHFRETGHPCWFHPKDSVLDYVQVDLREMHLDANAAPDWVGSLSFSRGLPAPSQGEA